MSSEEIKRDVERAREYEETHSRVTPLGENRFELSTGVIIAARFADKLRRVALVSLGKIVPRDVIIRDVSELNKSLYEKIVNEMKIDKLDLIKVIVEAHYKWEEKRIAFDNVKVIRYLTEDQCSSQIQELRRENEKLRNELREIKERIKKIVES